MPCLIPTILLCWWLSELEGEMRLWTVGPCWSYFACPWKQCCSLARPVLSASLSPNTHTHAHNKTPSRRGSWTLHVSHPKTCHTMSYLSEWVAIRSQEEARWTEMAKVNAKYFCCRKMLRKALNSSLAHIVNYLVCYLHNLSITNDYSYNLSSVISNILSAWVYQSFNRCIYCSLNLSVYPYIICIICLSV